MVKRCSWVTNDPVYIAYHDQEWGVPIVDDQLLFEFLILEGMQAGLSWLTILKKREHFRKVFDHFNAQKIANYKDRKIKQLLLDPGIIRNRLKVQAAITNAKAFIKIKEEQESFSNYIWSFVNHKPIQNKCRAHHPPITKNLVSDKLSKDLKRRGFKFVGSTICYAFMQAVGMVNDHTMECFRYHEIKNI